MNESRLKAILLYANYSPTLSYYDDWLEAFKSSDYFDVVAIDICGSFVKSKLKKVIDEVDICILLHSTNGDTLAYLHPIQNILESRTVPIVCFVGNEVNLPGSPIAEKIAFFKNIKAEYIVTQLLQEAGEWLYGECEKSKVVPLPHALNEKIFSPLTSFDQREIDIGVRTAKYNQYIGDDDRNRLVEFFISRDDLNTDISYKKRFKRNEWNIFLNSCKGTVSTEAGSFYLQRDDKTMIQIREWTKSKDDRWGMTISSDSALRKLGHKLPLSIRQWLQKMMQSGPIRHEAVAYDNVSFDEVYDRFFRELKTTPVYSKCISSRHFDAIGTKTCQIMIKGRFNDILESDQHYISVKSDLSNIEEALEKFNDPDFRMKIVNNAFDYISSSHRYSHRLMKLHTVLTS